MAQRSVHVFAHLPNGQDWVPAGRLVLVQEREVLASRFAYGIRYVDRPDAIEIDPVSLGLTNKQGVRGVELFPSGQLGQFGGLRDAAPDAWGRRVIEAQCKAPANSLDEADYLIGAGSERVGALDVRESLHCLPQAGAAPIRTLPYVLDAAQRVELGLPLPSNLVDMLGSGPSAGGARPKASVRDEAGVLWLAKFPAVGDTLNVAMAEHCTLQLAKRCGLDAAQSKPIRIGNKAVLLVRRFDRVRASADAREERLAFVSGLTLVACDEFDSRHKRYADLAQAIRDYVHPSAIRTNTEELFARMVFNIFVSNDDDHLRNHGFLYDCTLPGWRLSPLYDVVPRPAVAQERYLHLQVGSQGKLATLDNAMSAFSAFTPHRSSAMAIIRRIWGELRQWRGVFEDIGADGLLIDQMAHAVRDLDDICSPTLRSEIRK